MSTLEVLMKARAEVEKGWCKFALEDRNGNCCALGALVRTGEEWPRGARVLGELLDPTPSCGSIATFNNAPETTKADVVALYDRAIAAEAVKTSLDPAH